MWRDPSETMTGTAEKMWVIIGRLARRRRRRAAWQVHIRSSHGVICTIAWVVQAQTISQPNDSKINLGALTAAKEHTRSL